MGKVGVYVVLFIVLLFGGFYLWKNYLGLWTANAPAKENIVDLIQNGVDKIAGTPKPGQNQTNLPLKVPEGYAISIYAKDLGKARDLTLDPTGIVLVSMMDKGKVGAITAGGVTTVAEGLDSPHGLVFNENKLYIAETDEVAVYDYDAATHKAANKKKIIDLPGSGRHFTRSLVIKEEKLYVSIGSSCDTCVEKDPRYAAIWWANLDGSDFRQYATGLRNSVFMTLNSKTNEIWATEMGRDFLGDDLPPEEVNIIKEGNYGWPYCYGDKVPDPEMNASGTKFNCDTTISPHITFQAHSAPLGLAFLNDDLLVSYHGSWNRSVPTGYKVVRFKGNTPTDFVSGWRDDGAALGRPVDILVKGNGEEIFISDDKAGVIYLLKAI